MLVHSPVGPDSRVTKQARSMAERGWEVVLLAPGEVDYPVDIGKARLEILSLDRTLVPQRHLYRTTRVRSLLAYTSGSKGKYLGRLDEARLRDLYHQLDVVRLTRPGLTSARVAVLRARLLGRKTHRRWVEFRRRRTRALVQRRKDLATPIDRMWTRLWTRGRGHRAWRRLWPGVWEQEFGYGPAIDRLEPDVVHANDFMMLAVAARAKVRALAAGRPMRVVWDAREYLPGMSPWSFHPRWKPAHVALEREFAPYADAVVTVSEPLADMLAADFSLTEPPAIVLNAPVVLDPPRTCARDLRQDCGIDSDTPLVVYSGGAAPQRGLEVMIDALPQLPGVHTAFVVLPPGTDRLGEYVAGLVERAQAAGVDDRVHFLTYVDSDEVVSYLAGADLGVFPGLPFLNHTISLITKFLEYSQARLPIVVSNLKTMAETVTQTGQGEVFEPEDVPSYVAAVSKVLADPAAYRHAYDDPDRMHAWTWEPQADRLDEVYRTVLARGPRVRGADVRA
jgi:glycosyltransferase involved in cell wall biosynthesis